MITYYGWHFAGSIASNGPSPPATGAAEKPHVGQEYPRSLGVSHTLAKTGCRKNQIVSTAYRCTPFTALPDGSSIFANSCDQRNAVGVEHAIEGPTGTVRQAVGFLKMPSKIVR